MLRRALRLPRDLSTRCSSLRRPSHRRQSQIRTLPAVRGRRAVSDELLGAISTATPSPSYSCLAPPTASLATWFFIPKNPLRIPGQPNTSRRTTSLPRRRCQTFGRHTASGPARPPRNTPTPAACPGSAGQLRRPHRPGRRHRRPLPGASWQRCWTLPSVITNKGDQDQRAAGGDAGPHDLQPVRRRGGDSPARSRGHRAGSQSPRRCGTPVRRLNGPGLHRLAREIWLQ